ncbi:type ISP restriction/modification enzyme [Tsuneonella amylolytica]|uniref:type ISP restriction/modification enzyme n=1 Tax=Tsuneonella amylolytica TaxID=2338327 RepID=UPI000EA8FD56|nr:type ISP restriction/modification enzyme [Tsuneonella amylolytica]
MNISDYLDEVVAKYRTGQATEHSYRPALQRLFESIDPTLTVINEPKRSDAGMPDFIFQRKDVPIGWVEAKDVDKDVIKLKGYSKDQRKRYEAAFPNLIYTNGVDFEFIREGEPLHFVSIADFVMGLQPNPDKFDELGRQLSRFAEAKPISIRSAAKLAEIMAAKAAIIKDEIGIALADDPEFRSGLGGQFRSFKTNLLPNLTPGEFADIYAETITYGMFAARFHDTDLNTFSRQEAMEDLPASNPFLKGLFEYIAGPALPKRLEYIVDDLVQVMRASDPHDLFREFGKFTARNDPFVHFYEDFLAAYNPKKRKARGVWYTPEPVVDFIVRAVDDVLKTEFGLADGLADTGKVTIDWDTGQNDAKGKPVTIRKDVHKVQILDPATGTGTFLAKAVQLISDRVKARAPGKWSSYVEEDLLPRLHGFELLMASYAMCHMKLDMMLEQTGYKPSAKPPRLSVWLTNALEPAEREVKDLFFQPLAEEARGASEVKRQTPIMCVIGNPPYSGHSSNFGDWIEGLMGDYKVSPELKRPAQAKWLSDDYVKFIRMSEHLIEKSGEGVLGFITNHSYLDNPTFLDMRNHLRETFDRIFVLDLHGNAKKKEVSPDGGADKNVFDIQQGVAIIIALKRKAGLKAKPLAPVIHADLWGSRDVKYQALWENSPKSLKTHDVSPDAPPWRFQPTDKKVEQIYRAGVSLADLFDQNGSPAPGIVTTQDEFAISWTRSEASAKVEKFLATADEAAARKLFRLCSQNQWNYEKAKVGLSNGEWRKKVIPIHFRPLDDRYTVFDSHVAVHRRERATTHLVGHENLALAVPRQTRDEVGALVLKYPSTHKIFAAYDINFILPLYLYPEVGTLDQAVRLNLNPNLYAAICKAAEIDPADQAGPDDDFRAPTGEARPSEVKVFDYIYGVLHSPDYRRTFAEFLKINFPRVPYPPSPEVFRHVSEKGEALRRLHLMEPAAIGETPYPFEGEGDDTVAGGFPKFEGGRVQINRDQFFAGVPQVAWGFHIGGYQPAQKWLKDRRGRVLSYEDIGHYQKIVKILVKTDRIMREIELPLDLDEAPLNSD